MKLSHSYRRKISGALLPLLSLSLLLTACGKENTPLKTSDGEAWSEEWTTIGTFLGVSPLEDYTVSRSEELLTQSETFYTVWTLGDEISYTNQEGEKKSTFESQIHLLAEDTNSEAEAKEHVEDWQTVSDERYTYTVELEESFGDQEFYLCSYECPDDGGPASHGASASATRGNLALHIDVRTLDGQDALSILEEFLNQLHYAE